MSIITATIQLRRDTAANWTSTNPVLLAGEVGFETDTRRSKLGNGSTAWTSLPYINGTAAQQDSSAFDAAGSAAAAQAAAIAHADGLVVGLFDDRGNYDASTNLYPATGGSGTAGAVLKGDVWRISVAGTLGGEAIDVGDTIRALVDTPGQTAGNWAKFEANTQQATESIRGTAAIATQAEAEDDATTNDIDIVTPKKWWQAFAAGFTTVGRAVANLANPSAIRFLRINADNSVIARSASEMLTDLGADARYLQNSGAHAQFVPPAGQYIIASVNSLALATTGGAADRIDLFPFIPAKTFSVDTLALEVTTLQAGGLFKIGVYADNNGVPGSLIVGTGDLSGASNGVRTAAITSTQLVAGTVYWLAVHANASIVFRGIAVSGAMAIAYPAAGGTALSTLRRATGQPYASGLPSSGPAGTLTGASLMAVMLRVA